METILSNDEFAVHIDTSGSWLKFKVYNIVHFNDGGIEYMGENGIEDLTKYPNEKSRVMFTGSYCWRGVWEGRLYFPDHEYWGENLSEMHEFYRDIVIPWCENFIKKRDPENSYD
jgi:hypothetical protein